MNIDFLQLGKIIDAIFETNIENPKLSEFLQAISAQFMLVYNKSENMGVLLKFLSFLESFSNLVLPRLSILFSILEDEISPQVEQTVCSTIRRILDKNVENFTEKELLDVSSRLWRGVFKKKETKRKPYILLAFYNALKKYYPQNETMELIRGGLVSGKEIISL